MSQFTAPRPQLLKLRKPRNPVVAPSLMRQAGRHGPLAKAQRQQDKQAVMKELRQLATAERSP